MTNTEAYLIDGTLKSTEIRSAIQSALREEFNMKIDALRTAVRTGNHEEAVRIEAEMGTLESVVSTLERAAAKYRPEK